MEYMYLHEKKLQLYLILICLLPMFYGIVLWPILPEQLICWDTITASMSGMGSRFEIMFIQYIVMAIIELFIIFVTRKMTNVIAMIVAQSMIPIYVLYTTYMTLFNALGHGILLVALLLICLVILYIGIMKVKI